MDTAPEAPEAPGVRDLPPPETPYTFNITIYFTYPPNTVTGIPNGQRLDYTAQQPALLNQEPQMALSDEQVADIAAHFQHCFQQHGGCVPGVAWRRVAGGWRCTACVELLVEQDYHTPVFATGNITTPELREVGGDYWREIVLDHYRRANTRRR
ncbi:hypothetical protein LTR15_009741 [Elasticomyces elasticus]|nr:hypothetical protein LTR15_009741 [Elasticomyces elasticus]